MDKTEEQFYEMAAEEIEKRVYVKSIFSKAFSEAGGNKEKTVALYIKYRVEQLKDEYYKQQKEVKKQKMFGPAIDIIAISIIIWICIWARSYYSNKTQQTSPPQQQSTNVDYSNYR